MESIPYIVGTNNITVMVDGNTVVVPNSHPNFEHLKQAIIDKDQEAIVRYSSIARTVEDYSQGKVVVKDGKVLYNGMVLHNTLTSRMMDMLREGFDIDPMIKFLENLMENPSYRSVNELYNFLEATSLPITEDGHFLAYKKVRNDYKDIFSGTIDNSIGQVVKMERNLVNDNKDETCSAGLHFCSMSYLQHYGARVTEGGNRVVILKINPKNVVSIPADYNNAKGRACEYEVIGEHDSEHEEAFDKPVHDGYLYAGPDDVAYPQYDGYEDEDDDEDYIDYAYDIYGNRYDDDEDDDSDYNDDNDNDRNRHVTRAEASEILGISRNAVNKRVQRGTLKVEYIDGQEFVILPD